jgi:hypothetical protein
MDSDAENPKGQPGEGIAKERTLHIPFPETFTYVNCAAFAISLTELRLGFAEAMQDGDAVPKVGIVLTPEAAAVIALLLLQQVRTYEENFGEIRHPLWKAQKTSLVGAPAVPQAQGAVRPSGDPT